MNGHTLAVMQPYLFPYIGYFNLLSCCSAFIIYDDVNYIKQGWINRNRVLGPNGEITFTVPISNQSSYALINEVKIANIEKFKKKFKRTIEHCYSQSKHFTNGMEYVDKVLESEFETIGELAGNSVQTAAKLLEIECAIYWASKDFSDTKGMERSERLIAMTHRTGSSSYLNPADGSSLYNKKHFLKRGVELNFIKPILLPYEQSNSKKFTPSLSIIDMLMHLTKEEIKVHLMSYEIT